MRLLILITLAALPLSECVPRDPLAKNVAASKITKVTSVSWSSHDGPTSLFRIKESAPNRWDHVIVPADTPGFILEAEGGKCYKVRNVDRAIKLEEID